MGSVLPNGNAYLCTKDNQQDFLETCYLDSKTADLHFVFCVDSKSESLAAHRSLLAGNSAEFDRILNVEWKGLKCIPMQHSIDAFKEFLQFFYFTKVELSMENIVEIANFCKKCQIVGFIQKLEISFKASESIDVCHGYGNALLLEHENLIRYYEQLVQENSSEILKSTSLLESDRELFDKILTLLSKKYSGSERMAVCKLRTYYERNRNRTNFMGFKFPLIKKPEYSHSKLLFCDRRMGKNSFQTEQILPPIFSIKTKFMVNQTLRLKEIYIRITNLPHRLRIFYREQYQIDFKEIQNFNKRFNDNNLCVILSEPLLMRKKSSTMFEIIRYNNIDDQLKIEGILMSQLKTNLCLGNGTEVSFENSNGCHDAICGLVFECRKDWNMM